MYYSVLLTPAMVIADVSIDSTLHSQTECIHVPIIFMQKHLENAKKR